jgi:hypothetical protein
MSDPWLKVYAADMRGDPEMGILGLTGQMLLVHAWDIARDESTNYGELRMANGRPYTPETLAHVVPGATARLVRAWWNSITTDHDYAQTMPDGALFFPTLERHQRGTSNAVRQARHRNASRNASRNAPRAPKVTVEARSQNQKLNKPLNPLVDQGRSTTWPTIWTAFTSYHPTSKPTAKRKRRLAARVKEGFTDEILLAAIHGNHADPWCNGENADGKEYHAFELIFRDAEHVERYAALSTNGHDPTHKPSREEMDSMAQEAAARGFA